MTLAMKTKTKPVCAFCRATEDLETCRFPDVVFVRMTYADLEPGDRVKRVQDMHNDKAFRSPAIVLAIEPASSNMVGYVRVTLDIRLSERSHIVQSRSPVMVMRPGTCGVLCCPLHRCERGETAIYCANHWSLPSELLIDDLEDKKSRRPDVQTAASAARVSTDAMR